MHKSLSRKMAEKWGIVCDTHCVYLFDYFFFLYISTVFSQFLFLSLYLYNIYIEILFKKKVVKSYWNWIELVLISVTEHKSEKGKKERKEKKAYTHLFICIIQFTFKENDIYFRSFFFICFHFFFFFKQKQKIQVLYWLMYLNRNKML